MAVLSVLAAPVLLGACGQGKAPEAGGTAVLATVTPNPTEKPAPTPDSIGSTSVPPPASTILPPGQALTLNSIQMMNPTTGWGTDRATRNVLRTTDGGSQWRNVSPPDLMVSDIAVSYFLDADQAWLATAKPMPSLRPPTPTSVIVSRTLDGGKTWSTGSRFIIPAGAPAWLDFVDAENGWLMASLGAAAGSQQVEIYRTSDGGMNWQAIPNTLEHPSQAPLNALPLGCDKTGFTFLDPSTGWVTANCPGGILFFQVTHDGGQNWKNQELMPPPGYPADLFATSSSTSEPPVFVSSRDGFLLVTVYASKSEAFLYITHDGGNTWEPKVLPFSNPVGRPDFVDAKSGWILGRSEAPTAANAPTKLFMTQDGGDTWSELTTGIDLTDATIDFVNPQAGWALVTTSTGPGLFQTADGGHTWKKLDPRLIS